MIYACGPMYMCMDIHRTTGRDSKIYSQAVKWINKLWYIFTTIIANIYTVFITYTRYYSKYYHMFSSFITAL